MAELEQRRTVAGRATSALMTSSCRPPSGVTETSSSTMARDLQRARPLPPARAAPRAPAVAATPAVMHMLEDAQAAHQRLDVVGILLEPRADIDTRPTVAPPSGNRTVHRVTPAQPAVWRGCG
ncbi:MAG: hypothetical protein JO039_09610 [Solirubrobacterales bacterium]|nr:hypothetical protein [Solirubrobacterales bacterium]